MVSWEEEFTMENMGWNRKKRFKKMRKSASFTEKMMISWHLTKEGWGIWVDLTKKT
jgi:hypothetical protein